MTETIKMISANLLATWMIWYFKDSISLSSKCWPGTLATFTLFNFLYWCSLISRLFHIYCFSFAWMKLAYVSPENYSIAKLHLLFLFQRTEGEGRGCGRGWPLLETSSLRVTEMSSAILERRQSSDAEAPCLQGSHDTSIICFLREKKPRIWECVWRKTLPNVTSSRWNSAFHSPQWTEVCVILRGCYLLIVAETLISNKWWDTKLFNLISHCLP